MNIPRHANVMVSLTGEGGGVVSMWGGGGGGGLGGGGGGSWKSAYNPSPFYFSRGFPSKVHGRES